MSSQIDYITNIPTSDDAARQREAIKMMTAFGYLPALGATIQDVNQAKILFEYIRRAYPGYQWVVEVRDTIITVVNEDLDANWGFRLRDRMLDNDGKVITRFAGELLERYNLKRAQADISDLISLPSNGRNKIRVGE